MNICILQGNEPSNNSDKAIKLIKSTVLSNNVNFFEYKLPKDIPYLCHGCYACTADSSFIQDDKCQFAKTVYNVLENIRNADAIIICASVFSLAADGHIKAFLDHFSGKLPADCFQRNDVFKSALILSITPKKDIEPPVKALADSLANWGARRVHYTSVVIWGKMWSGMPVDKQNSCKEIIQRKTQLFYESLL